MIKYFWEQFYNLINFHIIHNKTYKIYYKKKDNNLQYQYIQYHNNYWNYYNKVNMEE